MFKACLALFLGGVCLSAQNPAAKAVSSNEPQGIPPRAAPGDYPSQTKAGNLTIAAEFKGHFVPTPQATFTTEDFVVVEIGLFGPDGARTQLSPDQFSIRINGKKSALPSQAFPLVMTSLKDPEWEPPASQKQSKTSFSGGGGGGQNDPPPAPVHPPPEVQRAMALKVQKATLAEGDRPLPQAGLLFFSYHGATKGIHSLQLLYKGPAGAASLDLEP